MPTRILLIQPKPETGTDTVITILRQIDEIRQEWPGIIGFTVGPTASLEYPVAATLRFVQPYATISIVHTPDYKKIMHELEIYATVLTLDIEEQDPSRDIPSTITTTYGAFSPTVEEQLRTLVYIWFQGTGQPLTQKTVMTDLLQRDDFGLSLLEFDRAIAEQFGVEVSFTSLHNNATFGDLLFELERELAKKKGSNKSDTI